MTDRSEILDRLRRYLLEDIVPDAEPEELQPDTELLRSGILDSISTLKAIAFIEDEWNVELGPRDPERFDTLESIATLVAERRAGGSAAS